MSLICPKCDFSATDYETLTRHQCTAEKPDMVNHPPHYTAGKVECIEAIEAATEGLTGFESYATGTVLKYIWRWKRKGGVEDLQKARWYLDRLIKSVEVSGE